MDTESITNLMIIIAMFFCGAYFSATETAFSSLNKVRIKSIAERNPRKVKRAALVLRLHEDFDKVLSTLLILNNLATLVAAGVSALLFVRFFGEIGLTLSTIVLTATLVFFADITPKSLAKESPEKFAMFSAPLLFLFVKIFTPINFLFIKWKIVLGKIFTGSDKRMTEEELYSVVEEAQNDGLLNEENKELLENAIEFKELEAWDIITPRMDLVAISENSSEEEILEAFLETGYSRLPIYRNSIDHIVGVINIYDFFKHRERMDTTIADITSPPVFVVPSAKVNDILKLLQKNACQLAVVTDEYGGTAGIVTVEDILEKLVGDIWDETDDIVVEFTPLGDNKYRVLCSAYVSDLFNYFGLSENIDTKFISVNGWILNNLGKMPEEGDTFSFENLTVTVGKTKDRRAIECIITVLEENKKMK